MVVARPSAYTAIIGRPTLNKLKAIMSTHHLMMKFSTDKGVEFMKGDQEAISCCYNTILKEPSSRETLFVE